MNPLDEPDQIGDLLQRVESLERMMNDPLLLARRLAEVLEHVLAAGS